MLIMLKVWLGCLLHVFLVIETLNQKSQEQQIFTSLRSLDVLLSDIYKKINIERKMLSLENYNLTSNSSDNPQQNWSKVSPSITLNNSLLNDLWILAQKEINQNQSLQRDFPFNITTDPEIDDFSQLPPGWPFSNAETMPNVVTTTMNPRKLDILTSMNKHGEGYCTEFIKQLVEMLSKKTFVAIETFFEVLKNTIWNMKDPNPLYCMEDLLLDRVKIAVIAAKTFKGPFLKRKLAQVLHSLQMRYFELNSNDNRFFDLYDPWFTIEQGSNLFDSLIDFDNYFQDSKPISLKRTQDLCEAMIIALLAPANQRLHTRELATWNIHLNNIYEFYYPKAKQMGLDKEVDSLLPDLY